MQAKGERTRLKYTENLGIEYGWFSLSRELALTYLSSIKQTVREAEITDYIMPIWLPYLASILAVIGGLIILVYAIMLNTSMHPLHHIYYAGLHQVEVQETNIAMGLVALMSIVALIGTIINLYVIYKWIARRNGHFSRVQRLYSGVISFLEALGVSDPEIASMKNIAEEARFRESEKSAGLWLILYIVLGFIAWAYIMHFLTRDFVEHEYREQLFFKNLAEIAKRRNLVLELPRRTVPDRNTVLYLVLTIITLGLFGLYWIYTVTRDPNEHFLEHHVFEQRLVSVLESML